MDPGSGDSTKLMAYPGGLSGGERKKIVCSLLADDATLRTSVRRGRIHGLTGGPPRRPHHSTTGPPSRAAEPRLGAACRPPSGRAPRNTPLLPRDPAGLALRSWTLGHKARVYGAVCLWRRERAARRISASKNPVWTEGDRFDFHDRDSTVDGVAALAARRTGRGHVPCLPACEVNAASRRRE
ncbi:hypothetical protein ACH4E7_27390 [Kitasatospora sp. NPDC018058]|uniref:hypothetical protein n=1 Tax=Kitasatospora sp. NPDC018058 TaxID=3364025 RepID=UPI0037BFEB27